MASFSEATTGMLDGIGADGGVGVPEAGADEDIGDPGEGAGADEGVGVPRESTITQVGVWP